MKNLYLFLFYDVDSNWNIIIIIIIIIIEKCLHFHIYWFALNHHKTTRQSSLNEIGPALQSIKAYPDDLMDIHNAGERLMISSYRISSCSLIAS